MDIPWPVPKAQLVTIVFQDVPPVLPRAMQSSPSLNVQPFTKTLVPIRSMPSVLGEVPIVLLVIPWMVMLASEPLNIICMEGGFSKVTFWTNTSLQLLKLTRMGRCELGRLGLFVHQVVKDA